jgi:hypothetical protein
MQVLRCVTEAGMKSLSLFTAAALAITAPAAAGPIENGIGLFRLQHSNSGAALYLADPSAAMGVKDPAFDRCTASIAQPIRRTYGQSVADRLRFDITGSSYRGNGDLRIFGTASLDRRFAATLGDGARQLARSIEFSCDVDSRGNLHHVDLGRLAS